MLFIWDIHLKTEKKDEILNKLKDIISKSDDENIIFLWDYVYHFSYNPKALEEFFDLLLDFSKNWKKIYILAWNHDYIKGHFIFAEAEKIINISNTNNIKILSNPEILEIENKKILFFPFYTRIAQEEEFIQADKKVKAFKWENKDLLLNLFVTAYQNWKQDNKNQKISWTINLDLVNFLLENQIDLFVHHFYVANTAFPWQFAKFSYKNIALSDEIFKQDFDIVSGHLHKAFKHKNYTCVGSFWNTSPLEENDTKIVFSYPDNFQQVIINPYIAFQTEEKISTDDIKNKWKEIEQEAEQILQSKIKKDKFDTKKVNLIIKSEKVVDINNIVDEVLLNQIEDVKYRQISSKNINNILESLQIDKEKLAYSFESWKDLAKDYITKKYPQEKWEYFKILEELGLI